MNTLETSVSVKRWNAVCAVMGPAAYLGCWGLASEQVKGRGD